MKGQPGPTPRPKGWPKLLRDWEGMRIVARHALSNAIFQVPAGRAGTITYARGGLSITWDACPHCALKLFMTGVDPRSVRRERSRTRLDDE